jgi:hypothetical protein
MVSGMDEPRTPEPASTIFIHRFVDTGLWHAVWSNDDGFIADFDSDDEAEMLAWARQRSDEISVWSEERQDYVRLPAEEA